MEAFSEDTQLREVALDVASTVLSPIEKNHTDSNLAS